MVFGPGNDALWDAPGLSEFTAPLFEYHGAPSIIVLNPSQGFHDMSGVKRDKWQVASAANNLNIATKNLAHLGGRLRSTMSIFHFHQL